MKGIEKVLFFKISFSLKHFDATLNHTELQMRF